MAGSIKIKNLQDAEFTLTHPDGAGAVSIDSNNIAKIDAVNTALGLKANTTEVIGIGQTWQDVISSRALGVTYTNTTGKPIMVVYTAYTTASIYVDGVVVGYVYTTAYFSSCCFIVPNGSAYKITDAAIGSKWFELR